MAETDRELFGIRLESPKIKKWKFALFLGLGHALRIPPRFHTEGSLPEKGHAIITVNHLSYLDPPLVYYAAAILAGRTIRMVARDSVVDSHIPISEEELKRTGKKAPPQFVRNVISFSANIGDPIAVNRSGPTLSSMREVYSTLDAGRIVAIALQETRRPANDLLDVKKGAAWIALGRPDVPIYVSGISGSELSKLGDLSNIITYRVDQPFRPEEMGLTKRNGDSIQILTDELTRRTAALIPYELKANYVQSHT